MSVATLESLESLDLSVSRETYAALQALQLALERWNKTINLVASSTAGDVWERHILDSAQLVPLAKGAARWLDIGSGGGFPGLVVATLLKEHAGASVDLVESNRKKAGFLQAMTGQLHLPARVHASRIEAVAVERIDVVTARAVAPLPMLLRLAQPWLGGTARGLFHKGRGYAQEISESSHSWSFDLIEHRSAIDPAGMILEISNLKPKQG